MAPTRHVPCCSASIGIYHTYDRKRPEPAGLGDTVDVVVVGGGPSGSVVARLLATWGHRVCLLSRPLDPSRALANSLPPSTHKLLAQVGILDVVERVGARTYGNTVWWGDREGQVQPFSADGTAWGYQVERALLDPELLALAGRSGAEVCTDARVQHVSVADGTPCVTYETGGQRRTRRARIVLDCSGRAGVVAVAKGLRRHQPGGRMQALVGVWERPGGWRLQDPSHTFIETCDEGWAWSIGTADSTRHVGMMVDGITSGLTRGATLEATYRAQLALTPRLHRQAHGARLARVFACDASVYAASTYAGPGFILVGDAGSTLNPLSSFGVKKALTSAWLAAVAANTCLRRPEREATARAFFSQWESQVWHVNLQRSRDFAREALARHRSAFWAAQADTVIDETQLPVDETALLGAADVRATLDVLRQTNSPVFSGPVEGTLVSAPIVRGDVIEMEDAVRLGQHSRDVVRYVRGVDLVALARMAASCGDIPTMFEQYQLRHAAAPLPEFLASLSLLIARGALRADVAAITSRA